MDWDQERELADQLAIRLHALQATRASSELVATVEPFLAAAIFGLVQVDERADLTQDALIRVTFRFASWDPEKGSFTSWAVTVARNLARDALRRHQRALAEVEDDSLAADAATISAIDAIDNADLIESLFVVLVETEDTHAQRVLAAIRDLDQTALPVTHEAIAGRTGSSISTVRRALVRIRVVLRDLREL